jgi:hypothetical protein
VVDTFKTGDIVKVNNYGQEGMRRKEDSTMEMPTVQKCTVSECSYNTDMGCHALAITVGEGVDPQCDTFYKTDHKGGAMDTTGRVGACKDEACRFNKDLECAAPSGINVAIYEGRADCETFEKR